MAQPPDDAVHVHSVQEEYFYMMVHRCDCGGAWQGHMEKADGAGPGLRQKVEATCFKCRKTRTFEFILDTPPSPTEAIRQINPTAEPSRAIDAVQWMDLAQFYLGRIDRLKKSLDRAQSLLDARQCIEEALKFYKPDVEDPPPESLWSDASRAKVAANPPAYRRSSLGAMLEKIPSMERLRAADTLEQKEFKRGLKELAKKRTRWWQVWRLWGTKKTE